MLPNLMKLIDKLLLKADNMVLKSQIQSDQVNSLIDELKKVR